VPSLTIACECLLEPVGAVASLAPSHSLGRAATFFFHIAVLFEIHLTYCHDAVAEAANCAQTGRNS
jgi:hypothetical protein